MEVETSQAANRGRVSRILVVEDNESQLRTLTAILEDEGFDTIGCSTATEALQHVGQEDIAVAIVDLCLSTANGTELLKRFGELGDDIPIVVHAERASYDSAKDAINHGAFAYVEKASDPGKIVYHVRRAFQRHLEQYADELEFAVAQRTRELQEACEELGCEIDRRERAAEALERNEALLATILETAPAGIGMLHGRVHMVGEMAASLAHEINQPLYAIANYVRGVNRRISRGTIDFEQLIDVMERVSQEVDRAAGIISHLREFVSKGQPLRSTVDIKTLIEDVMKLLEADIRRNHITVHRQLDDDIPAVSADPVQIQQVVVNLIRNVMDAMDEVPEARRILTIAARLSEDETVEIAISDNGKGLSPEIADDIFNAFFTTKDDGLGIGLAISRTIVEAHGGRLRAVPNRPQGTTFTFTIPSMSGGMEDELEAQGISRG